MPSDDEGAIWQSAVNSINQAGNYFATQNINRRTREWNEQQYAKQREDALTDWNTQNQYNSPTAQMERLRAAGLNPNLVYGKGADVISTSQPRSSSPGSWNPSVPRMEKDTGLSDYVNLQQQTLQNDNLRAQNTVLLNDAILKKAQAAATLKSADLTGWNLDWKKETHDLSLETMRSNLINKDLDAQAKDLRNQWYDKIQNMSLQQAAQSILQSQAQTEEIKQRIENLKTSQTLMLFEAQLNKEGITKNDAPWWRVLSLILGNDESKLPHMFENLKTK